MESSTSLLRLERLSRLYGNVIGVNDIHVELPIGAYGLVGPNGAGKSTLIGLLTGILKPSLGSVQVFGVDPAKNPSVLHRIGLCPATDISIPGVTPRQWLEQLLAISGYSMKVASARTNEILDYVGLEADKDRSVHSFSLGMRQRCKLAQAIVNDPDFLILDEPFNGLDPVGRSQMIRLLKEWRARGKSLLLSSHVLHEVEQVTDSFLFIYGGRLLASGTAGELRGLLADLPQELTVFSPDYQQLAQWFTRYEWLESIRLQPEHECVTFAVKRPIDFYNELAQAAESGIPIERLLGADGDMSTLFRTLIAHHRGAALAR